MLVLLGETRSATNLKIIRENEWGRIFLKAKPTPQPFEPWGFDNGAFEAFNKKQPFPGFEFMRRLDVAYRINSYPCVAVCPDIVAGGLTSLDFSLKWREKLRDIDWPWYLAVQDGMTVEQVEPILGWFAGIFLGGSDKFKPQAYRWCRLAHKHQKKFHYGRAGTRKKIQSAYNVGSDSLDSSFPLWTSERMDVFVKTYQGLGIQTRISGF